MRHTLVGLKSSSVLLLQTLQQLVNLQPNVTNSSGLCDSDSATLKLTTDAEKTNLTFVFTLVGCVIHLLPGTLQPCPRNLSFIYNVFDLYYHHVLLQNSH